MEVNKIEGGLEVYARAFDGKRQIPFGVDGTVDIERFKITNPPILIPDEKGDIVRTFYDELNDATTTERYREDPLEALYTVLEHNVSIIDDGRDSKIEKGKVGKTTLTTYPAAGASSPVDGRIYHTDANYSTANSAATGVSQSRSGRNLLLGQYQYLKYQTDKRGG